MMNRSANRFQIYSRSSVFHLRHSLRLTEFLASDGISRTKCLILDIAMPGMSGPELQQELNRRKSKIPIIFITAQRDETVRSRLIQQGAIACLIKPFNDTVLLDALNVALSGQISFPLVYIADLQ